jgi:hypothetical protein
MIKVACPVLKPGKSGRETGHGGAIPETAKRIDRRADSD